MKVTKRSLGFRLTQLLVNAGILKRWTDENEHEREAMAEQEALYEEACVRHDGDPTIANLHDMVFEAEMLVRAKMGLEREPAWGDRPRTRVTLCNFLTSLVGWSAFIDKEAPDAGFVSKAYIEALSAYRYTGHIRDLAEAIGVINAHVKARRSVVSATKAEAGGAQ